MSIGAMGDGAKWYYTTLSARDEYYIAPGKEEAGHYFGEGAKRLGLEGKTVEGSEFRALFDGYYPDGSEKKLVQNAGRKPDPITKRGGHQPGWDVTFTANKDISIIYALTKDEALRAEVKTAHEEAVKETLRKIEAETTVRIRNKEGQIEHVNTGLVVALHTHRTSRPAKGEVPDMGLHTHAILFNAGVREEGKAIKTNSLWSQAIYDKQKEYRAFYHAEFAKNIQKLGLELEGAGEALTVKGISKEVRTHFSKRTDEIEAAWEKIGALHPKEKDQVKLGIQQIKDSTD